MYDILNSAWLLGRTKLSFLFWMAPHPHSSASFHSHSGEGKLCCRIRLLHISRCAHSRTMRNAKFATYCNAESRGKKSTIQIFKCTMGAHGITKAWNWINIKEMTGTSCLILRICVIKPTKTWYKSLIPTIDSWPFRTVRAQIHLLRVIYELQFATS